MEIYLIFGILTTSVLFIFISLLLYFCFQYIIKCYLINKAFPYKKALLKNISYHKEDKEYELLISKTKNHMYIANVQPTKAGSKIIIYCHGNMDTVKSKYLEFDRLIEKLPEFDIYSIEYPGYDEQTHFYLTEKMIQESVWNSFERIVRDQDKDVKIYLVGFSIGTGVITYLSWRNRQLLRPFKIEGLDLISPFHSIVGIKVQNLFLRWFLKGIDSFPTYKYLNYYMEFVHISYCEQDTIIPSSHAKQLILNLNASHSVYKGFHGELLNGDLFLKHLKLFIEKCDEHNQLMRGIPIENEIELKDFEENNQHYQLLQE